MYDGQRTQLWIPLLVTMLGAGMASGPVANAATKKKPTAKTTIAAGKACPTLGKTDPGTKLECVQVGSTKLWEPRGVKANPFHLNDVGSYKAYSGNQYTLKVTGLTALAPADITPGGSGKYPMPAGTAPVRVSLELTYLGPADSNDLPASLTALVLVDAAGRKYETYAGDDKAGGGECSQFGEVPNNATRSLAKGVPITTVCVVLPAASVGPKLLVNLNWIDDPSGIWFKTTA